MCITRRYTSKTDSAPIFKTSLSTDSPYRGMKFAKCWTNLKQTRTQQPKDRDGPQSTRVWILVWTESLTTLSKVILYLPQSSIRRTSVLVSISTGPSQEACGNGMRDLL